MDYDTRGGRYRIRLQPSDIEKNRDVLRKVVGDSYKAYMGE